MLKFPRIIKNIKKSELAEIKNKETINRIKWVEYKQKQILYVDYSNFLNTDETIKTILNVNDFIKKYNKYNLLILVDVRNSFVDEKIIVEALKNNALIIKPYIKKAAVVGVTTTQQVILTIVNVFSGLGIKPFYTLEEAKDWLVK